MKRLIGCLFVFLCGCAAAQKQTEIIKISGADHTDFLEKMRYKYLAYTKAKIGFTNGAEASVPINFDNFLQTVTYINVADTLEIANPQNIAWIAVGPDSIFYDKGYYQWIASSGLIRLSAKVFYKEGERSLVGAFGTSSPAKNVESRTKILNNGAISSTELETNEVVSFTKETLYYFLSLKDEKAGFVPATMKNFTRLFPKSKVEAFVKENKVNLNKEEGLIDLLVYLSKGQ